MLQPFEVRFWAYKESKHQLTKEGQLLSNRDLCLHKAGASF